MQGRYDELVHVPKVCVEDCFRLAAGDAPDHGIAVIYYRNVTGRHALALCPKCGNTAKFLFRPPIVKPWNRYTPRHLLPHAENWACVRCHNLSFRSSQRSGTRAAMRDSRPQDYEEWRRLYPDESVSFDEFQKWKHRSYNRRRAKNKSHFGKVDTCVSKATT